MKFALTIIAALVIGLTTVSPGTVRAQEQDGSIGSRVRTNIEERFNNIRNNREYRNTILQNHSNATSGDEADSDQNSDENYGNENDDGRFGVSGPDISSTTPLSRPLPAIEAGSRRSPRATSTATTTPHFVRNLNVAFENLVQIRTRLALGIDSAKLFGSDVTNPLADLAIADNKLAQAKSALQNLNTEAAASSTLTEASSTPATNVKTALKDAKTALADTIKALMSAQVDNLH